MPKCRMCPLPATMKVGLTNVCSFEHAIDFANRAVDRKKAKELRDVKKKHREAKQGLRTRRDQIKIAQAAFNAYIRARAIRFGHTCISSGRPLSSDGVGGGFDCGHFRSIGSAPHLRFNMNNAWGQSKHDNQYKSGAVQEYRVGLIARIGLSKVEALENNNDCRKFDYEYLIRIAKIFRKKKRSIDRWHERSKLGGSVE